MSAWNEKLREAKEKAQMVRTTQKDEYLLTPLKFNHLQFAQAALLIINGVNNPLALLHSFRTLEFGIEYIGTQPRKGEEDQEKYRIYAQKIYSDHECLRREVGKMPVPT